MLLFSGKSEKKDLQLLATKLTEKIPDPNNAKEYYYSYLTRKKLVNQSKITTQQLKAIESINIVYIKSVTIEYPSTPT